MTSLILASSSPYRKALLERLQVPFACLSPDIDETPHPGEAPLAVTQRLARAKADAVWRGSLSSVIIGSDQLAELKGTPLGKPGTIDKAVEQLMQLSGETVYFHTAVCIIDGPKSQHYEMVVSSEVKYRTLSLSTIQRYLEREPAIDCAGAAKVEALGISLVESVRSDDPTALTGLPLIKTVEVLNAIGLLIP